jgi:hypothetical protein
VWELEEDRLLVFGGGNIYDGVVPRLVISFEFDTLT